MAKDVSICIPLYNARPIIQHTLKRIESYFHASSLSYEILFCDDASCDDSFTFLEGIARENPNVKVFYNSWNQGLGATLKKLFHNAEGETIIYCDCDLPFGTGVFSVLLEEIKNVDIVLASRYLVIENNVSFLRKTVSRGYYVLCKILFSIKVKDIGSGTVVVKRDVLKKIDFLARGFSFHVELYAKAAKKGLVVSEIGVKNDKSSLSSFSIARHGLGVFWDTLILWGDLL